MTTSFKEYRNKVSIIDVAKYLSYRYKKRSSRITPEFALYQDGKKIDEIIITNPNNSAIQVYFNRNGNIKDRGSVVDFILNRLDYFKTSNNSSKFKAVNEILENFYNKTYTFKEEPKELFRSQNKFDINKLEFLNFDFKHLHYLLKKRCISEDVISDFSEFIFLILFNKKYINISFPFRKPGTEEIKGFEIHNYNFKGFSEGSDKKNCCWIATKTNKFNCENVLYFENAIDAISFYQLFKDKYNLLNSAFISFGGEISKNQIININNYYELSKKYSCFDNDIAGKIFHFRINAIVQEIDINIYLDKSGKLIIQKNDVKKSYDVKNIETALHQVIKNIPIKAIKPHKDFKDFNDILQNKKLTPQKFYHV